MADLAAAVPPPNLTAPTAAPSADELAKRGQIAKTSQKFEASFLSMMLQQMFADGRIQPYIGARFPLADAAAALRHVAERKVLGKVVIDVA